jgi:hypothetical protein
MATKGIVKEGELLSEQQYYKVLSVNDGVAKVENARGMKLDVGLDVIAEGMSSSDAYEETVTLNRTELVSVLKNAGSSVFTVKYTKAVDVKVLREMFNNSGTNVKSDASMKRLLQGEERELRGRLMSNESVFGYISVEDLDVRFSDKDSHSIRRVNESTIISIVLENTLYIVR